MCRQSFHRKAELDSHYISEHNKKNAVECPHCHKLFKSSLKIHILEAHREIKYSCDTCEKQFNTLRSLTRHNKIVHQGLKLCADKYTECKVCGIRILDRKLNSHIEIHHLLPEKFSVPCPLCPSRVRFLPYHLNTVHPKVNVRRDLYNCRRCSRYFISCEDLNEHQENHKIYPCSLCEQSYDRFLDLGWHFLNHHNLVFQPFHRPQRAKKKEYINEIDVSKLKLYSVNSWHNQEQISMYKEIEVDVNEEGQIDKVLVYISQENNDKHQDEITKHQTILQEEIDSDFIDDPEYHQTVERIDNSAFIDHSQEGTNIVQHEVKRNEPPPNLIVNSLANDSDQAKAIDKDIIRREDDVFLERHNGSSNCRESQEQHILGIEEKKDTISHIEEESSLDEHEIIETEFLIVKEEPCNENFEILNQASNYDVINIESDHGVSEIVDYSNHLPLDGITSAIEENEFIIVVDDNLPTPEDNSMQQSANGYMKTLEESQTIKDSLVMNYENDKVVVGQVIVPENNGDEVGFYYNHDQTDDDIQIHFTNTNQQDEGVVNETEMDGRKENQSKDELRKVFKTKSSVPRDASNILFTEDENRILEETSENFNQSNLKKLQISEKPDKDEKMKSGATSRHRFFDNRQAHICPHCKIILKTRHSLKTHILTKHYDLKPFTCDTCDKRFHAKWHLNKHIKLDHNTAGLVECSVCNKMFKESYIKRHKEAAHGPKIETNCDICGGKYISRHVMLQHRRKFHK